MAESDRTPPEGVNVPQSPPDGLSPAVHTYLSQAFGRLSAQLSDAVTASRGAVEIGRELSGRMTVVEWQVFGSTPPPTVEDLVKAGVIKPRTQVVSVPAAAHAAPLVGRVTDAEMDVDGLAARELVRDAKIATIENHLKAQSAAAGLVVPDVAPTGEMVPEPSRREARSVYLNSRAGQRFILAVLALVLTAATTAFSAYTAATVGRAPAALPAAK